MKTQKQFIESWQGKTEPLVSICCITYNHEKYVAQTIEGFLIQETNFPFEIIIYDDASTDSNQETIRRYERMYPDIIKPIYQTKNQYSIYKGGINPRFTIPRAQGKYIALCEGDDYWTDPLKLQKQVDFLETHPEYSLVCGGYKSVDTDTGKEEIAIRTFKDVPESAKGYDITIERFLNQWVTKTLTLMFRADWYDDKLIERYSFIRDVHIVYTLLRKGKGYYMKEVLGVYREHKGGVFSSLSYNYKLNLSYLVYSELYRKNKDDVHLRKKAIRCLHRNIKEQIYLHLSSLNRRKMVLELFRYTKNKKELKNNIEIALSMYKKDSSP